MSHDRCRCCGRPLTDDASRDKGIGPDCEKNPACLSRNVPLPADTAYDLEWNADTRDVVMRRDERRGLIDGRFVPVSAFGELPIVESMLHFNIPRRHVDHSPSGWEWGYGGSGPADLALNILACFEDCLVPVEPHLREVLWDGTSVHPEVWRLHQSFKRQFIQTMPREGGTIGGDTIRAFIAMNSILHEPGKPPVIISSPEELARVGTWSAGAVMEYRKKELGL